MASVDDVGDNRRNLSVKLFSCWRNRKGKQWEHNELWDMEEN